MKKSNKIFFLVLTLCSVVLYACEKNTVEIEDHPEDSGPYQSLADFYSQKSVQEQVFTIDPQQQSVITGIKGTQIIIPGNSLYNDAGQQPTGSVTVTLKEIYSIKDMVLSHVPSTSNGNLLTWDGIFYIDFSSNNFHYKALFTMITMPATIAVPGMHVFHGADDADVGINWTLADTISNYVIADTTGISPFYSLTVDSLAGWIDCARFAVSPATDVSVVPQVDAWRGETVDIAVYLLFSNINSTINVANITGPQTVVAHNIPNGINAYAAAIGIGRISKKSYFGLVNFTVTTGQPVTVTLTQADEEITTALQPL